MATWSVVLLAVLAALLVLAVRRHVSGVARLRRDLRRVALGDLDVPLMLDMPRGLRSAERDLKSIAAHQRDLGREVSRERKDLSVILEHVPGGILLVDRGLRVRLANRGFSSMFGLNVSPVGRTVMEVLRNTEVRKLVEDALAAGEARRAEVTVEGGQDAQVCEFGVSPVVLDDGSKGVVVAVYDITKIRGLERMRGEFVANVSHELRTPLTIIVGYLETLLDGGLDDRVMTENALRVMFKHTERLRRLVDDLLTISRAESRALPLQLEEVELVPLLSRVIEQFGEPIRLKNAHVGIEAPDTSLSVEGDAVRLEHMMVNLLQNALNHANRPGLELVIRIERRGEAVHVEFADNGPGIPYEDQKHVFERFFRVQKHRSRETGGTGLGLSIVKNIAQAHGGSVSVHSIPGQGATFLVELPVVHEGAGSGKTHPLLPAS